MATLTKQNRIKVITVSLFTSILVPLTCLAEPEIVGLEEANNGSILEIIAEMLRPLNYIFYRLKYVYIFPGVSIFWIGNTFLDNFFKGIISVFDWAHISQ